MCVFEIQGGTACREQHGRGLVTLTCLGTAKAKKADGKENQGSDQAHHAPE